MAELLSAVIEPASWDVVGGPGSIASGSVAGVDVLVVSQTRAVHEQISQLLENVRTFLRCNQQTDMTRLDEVKK